MPPLVDSITPATVNFEPGFITPTPTLPVVIENGYNELLDVSLKEPSTSTYSNFQLALPTLSINLNRLLVPALGAFISNFADGLVVPTPTLPEFKTTILGTLLGASSMSPPLVDILPAI
jgi:hypothetical protein